MGPEWNNCRVSIITIGSVSPTVGPRNVIAPASNLMSCVWSDPDKVCVCNTVVKTKAKVVALQSGQHCVAVMNRERIRSSRFTCHALPPTFPTVKDWHVFDPFLLYIGHTLGFFFHVGWIGFPFLYNNNNIEAILINCSLPWEVRFTKHTQMWAGETWLSHNASSVYNVHKSRDVQ